MGMQEQTSVKNMNVPFAHFDVPLWVRCQYIAMMLNIQRVNKTSLFLNIFLTLSERQHRSVNN